MRFFADGPNIPDDLLNARDEGRVIFFCGAGVSRAYAGLPTFAELAARLLDRLGSAEDSDERRLFNEMQSITARTGISGLLSADRIFSFLEKNFEQELIASEVAQVLSPPRRPDLRAHQILLSLSRLPDSSTRLVTTNFDRLFENCDPSLPTATRSRLPRVIHDDGNWGIVHLHGKVTEDYTSIESDGLVLNSGEFGDAYLAQGWARDFVRDVLENYVAVFVGYSADDPPVRYLLEGLSKSHVSKNPMYAFQDGPADEAIARWDEKNVTAIPYQPDDQHHSVLYNTLAAWAKRAEDPIAWRSKIFRTAKRGPQKLAPHQRGMVAHIVKSTSGAIALSRLADPLPPEWLCVFDKKVRLSPPKPTRFIDGELVNPFQLYRLDDDPMPPGGNDTFSRKDIPAEAWDAFAFNESDNDRLSQVHSAALNGYYSRRVPQLTPRLSALADWIAQNAHNPATIWWASGQAGVHPQLLDGVSRTLRRGAKPTRKVVRQAWRLLAQSAAHAANDDLEQYQLEHLLTADGWTPDLLREYTRVHAPKLVVKETYRSPVPPKSGSRIRLRNLIDVDVSYPERPDRTEYPDRMLPKLVREMRKNLETAIDLELETSAFTRVSSIEAPIDPDPDRGQSYDRAYGLSGYTLRFIGLFRRLMLVDQKAAAREWMAWRNDDAIFQRCRFWAASQDNIGSAEQLGQEVLSLPIDTFWSAYARRDLLLSLKRRWSDLSIQTRKKIERRILKGPTRYRSEDRQEHKQRAAFEVLNVLHWLHDNTCALSIDLSVVAPPLREVMPEWQPEFAASAAEGLESRSGMVRTDETPDGLLDVPLPQLLSKATALSGRQDDRFVNHDPFRGLSETNPVRSFAALVLSLRNGTIERQYWETFLSQDCRKDDPLRLKRQIALRLSQIPAPEFASMSHAISRWFENYAGEQLRDEAGPAFDELWAHFIQALHHTERAGESALVRDEDDVDWATEAINAPAGNLTELHMTDPRTKDLGEGEGLPGDWLERADELLGLPGNSARFAKVILAYNLSWLFFHEPDWTTLNFINPLEGPGESDDKEAIWAGFFWGAKMPQRDLFVVLKPKLLDMAARDTHRRRRHSEILSGILLSGWGTLEDGHRLVTNAELRTALLQANEEFRSHTIWQLSNWSEGDYWSGQIALFLKEVWPKQKKARTPRIGGRLADLAFRQKQHFPEVVAAVVPLLSGADPDELMFHRLRDPESEALRQHPEATLDLLFAVLGENASRWPYGASAVVRELATLARELTSNPKMIALRSRIEQLGDE